MAHPAVKSAPDMLLESLYSTGLFNIEDSLENPASALERETKRLQKALDVRRYSKCTIERYKKRKVSASTQNQALAPCCSISALF